MEPNQENSQKSDAEFVVKKVESPILSKEVEQNFTSISTFGGLNLDKPSFYQENKFYIWAICAGILILSILAFFAFRKTPLAPTAEANVKVEIIAPETVPSGGDSVYQIKVENLDTQKLVALQLEMNYPSGLVYQSSNIKPENLSGKLFFIPDLISGQNAVIILKTKVYGNINENKTFSAKLIYKYDNSNLEFTKETKATFRLSASDILVEVSGPINVSNAQIALYNIKYKNNSDTELKGARIKIIFPDGFNFATASPLPDLGNNIWNVGNLPKEYEGFIEFQGNFKDSSPGEGRTFSVEFLTLGKSGDYFVQSQNTFTSHITSLPLLVTQNLTSGEERLPVKPGEILNYEIKYQNNASVSASGVNIVLTLDSKVLDFTTIQAEGAQVSGNVITWNAASNKNLESLAPSEGGSLSFSVGVKDPPTKDSARNLTIISNIKIKANEYETYFPGNGLTLKIASLVNINKTLSFASGALPPQVGKATFYKVGISILNASNELSEGLLTAFITSGKGAFIAESVNGSEVKKVEFDESTGKVVWKVGTIVAHSGKFSPAKILEFNIKIIPSVSQVGEAPVLLKDISFFAKDSFTEQDINLSSESLSIDDLSGESRYQNGRVIQ